MANLVHVIDMQNQRSFPVNGTPITAREMLAKFYHVAEAEVDAKVAGKTLRIVNQGPLTDLSTPFAGGEDATISIYEAEVARGGVKGACWHTDASFESFSWTRLEAKYQREYLEGMVERNPGDTPYSRELARLNSKVTFAGEISGVVDAAEDLVLA